MAVDVTLAIAVGGLLLAVASILYARAQAVATRRQAEQAARAGALEASRATMDGVRAARQSIEQVRAFRDAFMAANPKFQEAAERVGGLDAFMAIRTFQDSAQDTWFLRKAGAVEDHHWRTWAAALPGIVRMPQFMDIFRNAQARGAFDPEFVEAIEACSREGRIQDPLGRVTAG